MKSRATSTLSHTGKNSSVLFFTCNRAHSPSFPHSPRRLTLHSPHTFWQNRTLVLFPSVSLYIDIEHYTYRHTVNESPWKFETKFLFHAIIYEIINESAQRKSIKRGIGGDWKVHLTINAEWVNNLRVYSLNRFWFVQVTIV